MGFSIITGDAYHFDMDHNGFPAFTEENVKRINFILENDSNYRFDDEKHPDSVCHCIKKLKNPESELQNKDVILEIVKRIDKQNSTHQSSTGSQKNTGENGLVQTAEHIEGIKNFYHRLEEGDAELVNEISQSIKNRRTFSFASKYCTYVSRYLFEGKKGDRYCIYDKILCDILPYYAWVYLREHYKARSRSKIDAEFCGDYDEYRKLIDRIRESSKAITGYEISRKDFDHLLWYYFKGDRDIREGKRGKIIYKSRITKALELVPPRGRKKTNKRMDTL